MQPIAYLLETIELLSDRPEERQHPSYSDQSQQRKRV